MICRLNVVDGEVSDDSFFDHMDRASYGTYVMHRSRLISRCQSLFPDFSIPYVVLKDGFVRVEAAGITGRTRDIFFGGAAPARDVANLLESLLDDSLFRSNVRFVLNTRDGDYGPILSVEHNYDAVFEELKTRGHEIKRRRLVKD